MSRSASPVGSAVAPERPRLGGLAAENGQPFQLAEHILEHDLGVVLLDDAGEPGRVGVLAVDGAGPAHRVHRRLGGGVRSDQIAGQGPRPLQALMLLRRLRGLRRR